MVDIESLKQGLVLFSVGFPSVFLMLYLVILLGRGLIIIVNKYIPYPVEATTCADNQTIKADTIVAIASAVSVLTGGQRAVTRIERIDKE